MRGMTKSTCLMVETLITDVLTRTIGEPLSRSERSLEWKFPHGSGSVSLTLFKDSVVKGREYRNSWLACRLDDPAYVTKTGYVVDQGFPYPFSKTSGKFNLHFSPQVTREEAEFQLATHLFMLAREGSPEKDAFGNLTFEVAS